MAYYFQHPDHTGNEIEFIGKDHCEAYDALLYDYELDPVDMFNLMFDGHIWQDKKDAKDA